MLEIATNGAVLVFLAGLFGLLIGSFLNVCIYRWTRDLSVVKPRSACPSCEKQIVWYDNVPVVSYLVLGGRCRSCRSSISWTYPVVELLTGLFFAYFVALQGVTLAAFRDCLFASILIGLIFADLDTRLLPDEFTIGGLVAGLALAIFAPLPPSVFTMIAFMSGMHPGFRVSSLGEAVTGALIPTGAFWLLRWSFEKLRHREGAGFGDVKMIAMMGAFFGIGGVLLTLLIGSFFGSLIGIAYIKITGKDPATYGLPMATFLGAAALVVLAANGGLTGWYEHLLQ